MAKHNEKHLATEQLSAFIDQDLSPEEQAVCESHLQGCQQCQNALASLRQTVILLRALPQPQLPRSFVLPLGVAYLQERAADEGQEQREVVEPTPINNGRRPKPRNPWLNNLRRTTRAASMIAAVIGLIFLLSSGILGFHGGGASSTGNTPSATGLSGHSTNGVQSATPTVRGIAPHAQSSVPATTDRTKTTATVSPTQVSGQQQGQNISPLPDIGTGSGRLDIGFFLLILGIVGFLLTQIRRQRRL